MNLCPIQILDGATCPITDGTKENIDMLIIRENAEGEYAGAGDWLYKGKPEEVVLQTGVFSRKGTERIIRHAYEVGDRIVVILKSKQYMEGGIIDEAISVNERNAGYSEGKKVCGRSV